MRLSLEAKFLLVASACSVIGLASAILVVFFTDSLNAGLLVGLALTLPLTVILTRTFTRPINRILQALRDGVASFKDGDFSVSLGTHRNDELGALVKAYNEVGDVLRAERLNLFHRELLLDTVIQSTPTALVLTDANDHVVFSNMAARRLFFGGKRVEGFAFSELLRAHRPEFLSAVQQRLEGLFTAAAGDDEEIFHLSHGHFTLNARPHHLYLFKQMTRELNRQEVATWKKVIRVISHELNNSLAPIASLAHTGGELNRRRDFEKLEKVFSTIEERAAYLKQFIDGYARFAKLPEPRQESVEWQPCIDAMHELAPFMLMGKLPATPGWFDPAQMQQVMLNLLKNARESGSSEADIELEVREISGRFRIDVRDRGTGMSDSVLQHALLPFYSTKKTGTGLGLPLCREIVEAHGGRLNIANRNGGGLEVSLWLPSRMP